MTTLSKRIVSRRKELGLSPTDLAKLLGISLTAVLKWEKGQTANLKHEHLFALADALNVHARWLAIEEGPKVLSPTKEAYRLALARCAQATARKNEAAATVWQKIAMAFGEMAMVLFFMVPALFAPAKAEAAVLHKQVVCSYAQAPFFAKCMNAIHICAQALGAVFRRAAARILAAT